MGDVASYCIIQRDPTIRMAVSRILRIVMSVLTPTPVRDGGLTQGVGDGEFGLEASVLSTAYVKIVSV